MLSLARSGERLSLPEVKLGVLPSYGGAQFLPALAGQSQSGPARVRATSSPRASLFHALFTFGPANNGNPIWSPDGRTIVFRSDRNGVFDLFEKPASGEGEEKALFKSDEIKFATSWSRDGRYIAFSSQNAKTGWDSWALPTFGDRKPFPIAARPFNELNASFSPDTRFVGYQSNESGSAEIYVQSFPVAGGKWQISNSGGTDPSWSADGKELYYRSADQKLMAVEIEAEQSFKASIPRPLFAARVRTGAVRNKYLATKDGQRFLLVAPLGREALIPTTVVLNWHAELSR